MWDYSKLNQDTILVNVLKETLNYTLGKVIRNIEYTLGSCEKYLAKANDSALLFRIDKFRSYLYELDKKIKNNL